MGKFAETVSHVVESSWTFPVPKPCVADSFTALKVLSSISPRAENVHVLSWNVGADGHDNALSKMSNALTTFNQRASDVTRKSLNNSAGSIVFDPSFTSPQELRTQRA